MERPIRTFIAIKITDSIRERIGEFQSRLRQPRGNVKWIRPKSIHITLKFLGDVEVERIEEISQVVEKAVDGVGSFTISVGGVGAFPNERRPRVLWIGVDEGGDILSDLASRIDMALSQLGFEKEKRKYSAHLTIGRVRSPKGIESTIKTMYSEGFKAESFEVSEIDVMKSQLLPTGAVYTVLHKIKLKG